MDFQSKNSYDEQLNVPPPLILERELQVCKAELCLHHSQTN